MTPESRAVANLAAAPASAWDRRAAALTGAVAIVVLAIAVPLADRRTPDLPGFVPVVVAAGAVALVLTALLFALQARVTRDATVAAFSAGYAWLAAGQLWVLLTFPGVFSRGGLFEVGAQSSATVQLLAWGGFAVLAIVAAVVARLRLRFGRNDVILGCIASVVVFAVMVEITTAGHARLPQLVGSGERFTPLMQRVAGPLFIALDLVALGFTAWGLRTVTQLWVGIAILAHLCGLVAHAELADGRYTFAWYVARLFDLLASGVVLAVFVVKINDVMLRLAAGSRTAAEAIAAGEARYASLANVVPQLLWTTDAAGRVQYVNERWTAFTGYELERTRDGGLDELLHPEHLSAIRDEWRHSLRTGDPFSAEYRLREAVTGRYRWFLVNALPVRDARNRIVGWIGTCTDIDAQKRLEERDAFLARAGERLAASLDTGATVSAIKSLAIPRLADRLWIAMRNADEEYVLASLGSTSLADELDTRRWIGAPLPPPLRAAVEAAIEGGEPLVIDRPDQFPDPWMHELPPGAAVLVPLVSGETPIGACTLVRDGGRAYDVDDVGLIREFARRAALSLDHARLYERERSTADALQRAMLPAQLPTLPGVEFAASYSAASESQRVGGDFYDAFMTAGGKVALTIGDVTGHGLEAAVIMGEIRQALRAASMESTVPSAILDRASRLLIANGRSVFVTAIVAVLDPLTGAMTYATAGHPPPLLADTRGIRRLSGSGLPIGLRDEEGVDFTIQLHAPCTLVLFTDGLLEFSRDLDEADRRIDAAIAELSTGGIDHLASAIMKHVLGDAQASDDIAILTVQVARFEKEPAGELREWRFRSSDALTAVQARRETGALAALWSGEPAARATAELAFGELVGNVVRHAPGGVFVRLARDPSGLVRLSVEDSGGGFVPQERAFDPFAISGRGLALVQAVAGDLRFERSDRGGTRATVEL